MPIVLDVLSPLAGTAVPLPSVPEVLPHTSPPQDGLMLLPSSHQLLAPITGTVTSVQPHLHTLVLRTGEVEILIRLGPGTSIRQEAFKPFVQPGDTVTAGQKLLEFAPAGLPSPGMTRHVLILVKAPAPITLREKVSGPVQPGQKLFTLLLASLPNMQENQTTFSESGPISLGPLGGLPAKSAAVLADLAAQYPYDITLFHDKKSANAKSIVSLLGLSLSAQDEIILRVYGPQAQANEMLLKLHHALQHGLPAPDSSARPTPATGEPELPAQLTGLCACGGLASGPSFLVTVKPLSFEENTAHPQAECALLEQALHTLAAQLKAQIAAEKNTESRDILNAHLLLLQDPLLAETTHQTILQGKTAAFAFNTAIRQSIDILKKTKNRFLMERIADLKDIRREVLGQLTGQQHRLPEIPPGSLLVAEDLLPSDVAALPQQVAGVLLAHGSPTAHAGILLRNRNIPAVVQAGPAVLNIPQGTPILLDADQALALLCPTPAQQADFEQRKQRSVLENQRASQTAQEPAQTKDHVRILVEANVADAEESARAKQAGADGLGLVRTEFLFQNRTMAPTEEEQTALYQAIVAQSRGMVTFRLLDAGGDKPIAFINIPAEENPIAGIRGVRAFTQNELFFRSQLRALLRVRPLHRVRIMLPMVSFVSELVLFKQMVEQEKKNLGIEEPVQIGVMIEVPAAALTAEQLAREADFFSLGTNDLTQYTLAIDRGHKQLSPLVDPLHPSVLKLMAAAAAGAGLYQKPVAVCGAAAADPAAVALLIGLGVTELSVSAAAVARTKALVRKLAVPACRQLLQQALQLAESKAVRQLAEDFLKQLQ